MIHENSNLNNGCLKIFKFELQYNHGIGEDLFCNYPKNRENKQKKK